MFRRGLPRSLTASASEAGGRRWRRDAAKVVDIARRAEPRQGQSSPGHRQTTARDAADRPAWRDGRRFLGVESSPAVDEPGRSDPELARVSGVADDHGAARHQAPRRPRATGSSSTSCIEEHDGAGRQQRHRRPRSRRRRSAFPHGREGRRGLDDMVCERTVARDLELESLPARARAAAPDVADHVKKVVDALAGDQSTEEDNRRRLGNGTPAAG